jgi:hypothetical protein
MDLEIGVDDFGTVVIGGSKGDRGGHGAVAPITGPGHSVLGLIASIAAIRCDAADLTHPRPVGCQMLADRGCGFDLPGFDRP